MLEDHVISASIQFVKMIKETQTYKRYYYQLEKIKRQPEIFLKVNEFRRKNFEIQNTDETENLFDKMDAFEKEYEKFRENPIVDDFLRAELAFCRMMQEINVLVTEELNFE